MIQTLRVRQARAKWEEMKQPSPELQFLLPKSLPTPGLSIVSMIKSVIVVGFIKKLKYVFNGRVTRNSTNIEISLGK